MIQEMIILSAIIITILAMVFLYFKFDDSRNTIIRQQQNKTIQEHVTFIELLKRKVLTMRTERKELDRRIRNQRAAIDSLQNRLNVEKAAHDVQSERMAIVESGISAMIEAIKVAG